MVNLMADTLSPVLLPNVEPTQPQGWQYLTFQLAAGTQAMLPISHLTEVLTLALDQVTPIPDLPAWVLGVHNWRGEILWVVDLAEFSGVTSSPDQVQGLSSYSVLVAQSEQTSLGLAVVGVTEIIRIEPDQIESGLGSGARATLSAILRGYALGPQGEMLLVLDTDAICERALQASAQQ